jgi:hypothetical protein
MVSFCLSSALAIALTTYANVHSKLSAIFHLLSFQFLLCFATFFVSKFMMNSKFPVIAQVLDRAGVFLGVTAFFTAITIPLRTFVAPNHRLGGLCNYNLPCGFSFRPLPGAWCFSLLTRFTRGSHGSSGWIEYGLRQIGPNLLIKTRWPKFILVNNFCFMFNYDVIFLFLFFHIE